MPGKNSPSAQRARARHTNISYATGARRALSIVIRESKARELDDARTLELFHALHRQLEVMREAKDCAKPFLDRAVNAALISCGHQPNELA